MARFAIRMSVALLILVPVLTLLVGSVAQAQGVLIVVDKDYPVRLPRPPIIIWPPHPIPPHPHPHPIISRPAPPPVTYKVKELEVNAKLTEQVAQVQVAQTFENTGSRQMEVSFVFPLPYDGAIESMTLMVDGKEYPAKLLDAKEARKLYEEIVRKNQDPALLEWMGTGMFKTSVFPVPAGAKRTVNLRYTQLCRKQQGLTDFIFPLSTAKYTSDPVEKIEFRVTIESQDEIKNVWSPSHQIELKRPEKNRAVVTYSAKKEVPTADFRMFFDTGKGKLSTRVLSYRPEKDEEGYFLMLASPEIKGGDEHQPKTVVFVIDRSGSMSGEKIQQVRSALKDVLNKLRPGDLFNIIAYDSHVESFKPELQKFDDETRKAALGFVESIYAGGSTNIDGALKTALAQLQDSKRPSYIVFLTDGLPTAGETNEAKIVANSKSNNKVRARVFSFGVGYDVNSRLLDRLSRDNNGQSDYVRPKEDIEAHVGRLYSRIEAPVMTNVDLQIALDAKSEEGKVVNRVYPKGDFDLFAGEQLVIVGRYKKPGTAKVTVSGKVGEKDQKFDFPAELVEKSRDESNAFIEKLWAVRRIGEILDEIDLKGKNDELVKELVGLSTKHGILTPYTSFMADDRVNLRDTAMNVRRAEERLAALDRTDGSEGVAQRALKGHYQYGINGGAGMGAGGEKSDAKHAATPAPAAVAEPGMLAKSLRGFAADAAAAPSSSMSGAMGGAGGIPAGPGGRVSAARARAGDEVFSRDKIEAEAKAVEQNVRQVGNRTFFRRDNRWVDTQVTKDQETNATRVKQFSQEYFELANRHGRAMSQYMAFDEPVLLNFDNQAYLIEP